MSTQRPYRKLWWGYMDMGAIQIPPNPQYLILTDRGTGVLWWITLNANNGTPLVAINSVFPCNSNRDGASNGPQTVPPSRARNNCVIYDAFAEPIVGFLNATTFVRLIVRNGLLGASVETFNQQAGTDPNTAPINLIPDIGLIGFNGQYATLILDPIAAPKTLIVWTLNTLVQTPNPSSVQTYD